MSVENTRDELDTVPVELRGTNPRRRPSSEGGGGPISHWDPSCYYRITSHAVYRYLERWVGIPKGGWTHEMREFAVGELNELLKSPKLKVCVSNGPSSVTLVGPEGIHLVVGDGSLKTVLPKGEAAHGGRCTRCCKSRKKQHLANLLPSERRRYK